MTAIEALAIATTILTDLGFTESAGAWADDERGIVYAGSLETHGPATYNHPVAEVQGRRAADGTWTFTHNNRPIEPSFTEGAEMYANQFVTFPENF